MLPTIQREIRVGIDIHSTFGERSGLGTSTYYLVQEIEKLLKKPFQLRLLGKHPPRHMNTFRRLIWENISLPCEAKREKLDLLHIPAFAPPLVKSWKLVLTVYDIIGMKYPNQLHWPSAFYWGQWVPYLIAKADAIITSSEHTKKDLLNTLRLKEKNIHVVPISGHETFSSSMSAQFIESIKAKFRIHGPYFLFVGTLEPRKNLERCLDAFGLFLKINGHLNYQFVVAGSKNFGHGLFFDFLAKKLGDAYRQIIFPGYLSHEELNALYCGATGFLFPSLYEGFGIPVLEAMGAGTPVIASSATSVPEVAGKAALLVDPLDTNAIAQAMTDLAENSSLRSTLIEKGFEHIKSFSWRKAAAQILKIYESVL